MRRAVILGAAAALAIAVAAPSRARAGSCGGGGSSGGSSSGSSSSSSSSSSSGSSSSSSSSSEPACQEVSGVVGHQLCSSFGGWSTGARLPRLHYAFGTTYRRLGLGSSRFEGTAEHDESIAYAIVGDEMSEGGTASAVTFDLRIGIAFSRFLYAGVESNVGAATYDSAPLSRDGGDLELDPTNSGPYFGGGAYAGVGVDLGRLTMRGELFAGGRLLIASVTSRHGDCVHEQFVTDAQAVIEPRVAADLWVSPWVGVGARLGSDLRRREDVSFGVYLRVHLRAFDGARRR